MACGCGGGGNLSARRPVHTALRNGDGVLHNLDPARNIIHPQDNETIKTEKLKRDSLLRALKRP